MLKSAVEVQERSKFREPVKNFSEIRRGELFDAQDNFEELDLPQSTKQVLEKENKILLSNLEQQTSQIQKATQTIQENCVIKQ